jgi:signal transduction histidine kinase/ActR/RegA family two-component response regulator
MHGNLRFLTVAAGVAITIGLVVIAGWILHIASLTVFAPAGAPMVVNTAVSMIATGCGLYAVVHRRRKLAFFLSSFIGLMGLLNLFQFFSGRNLGIDNLLWRQTVLVPLTLPGRMGPHAAASFLLLSLAINLLAGKRPRLWLISVMGGTLLFLALLPLLSEFIALSPENAWASYRRMALPTALGMSALALALLWWISSAYEVEGSPIALLTAAVSILIAVATATERSFSALEESNTWLAHSLEVEVNIEHMVAALSRMDASTRAFALTGNARFVQQTELHKDEVRKDLDTLVRSTRDNPSQQQREHELGPLIDQKFSESDAIRQARESGGPNAAIPLIETPAQEATHALVMTINELRNDENRLLVVRSQATTRTERNAQAMQLLGGALAATLVGLAFWLARQAAHSQRIAEAALAKARDQAVEASRLKSEFLANMSHEIRTPMNGVIGMTSLLLETPMSAEQRECLDTIRVSGEMMLVLIGDILDFSKIESGRFELEMQEFDPVGCIEESIALFKAKAQEKHLELLCSVDPSVPHGVIGDATRVRQIVVNLLGNALKFTAQGEIEVAVECVGRRAESTCTLAVSVRDTGIGIPEDKRHRLFLPFSQVDASTSRSFGGTGLGLSISKRLCELMGGTIEVKSTKGVGSVFRFTVEVGLPSVQHSTSSAPAAAAVGKIAELHPFKILLAEDNPVNQVVAQRMLTRLGYRVDTVADGREAVDAVLRQPYDVILMDFQMPVLDGLKATMLIRQDAAIEQPWIIAMTADAMTGDRERFLAAGMNDYISKPVKLQELHDGLLRVRLNRPLQTPGP